MEEEEGFRNVEGEWLVEKEDELILPIHNFHRNNRKSLSIVVWIINYDCLQYWVFVWKW